jgi:peptidoglycan/LPS O-acetylase OafA/YrhL
MINGANPKSESTNLDLLRSVAVLCVFFNHLLITFGFPWRGNGLGALGRIGVLLFFIHTSLVLMMSLSRLERGEGSLVGRFYIRRAFRIYPLSILTVLLIVLLRIPEHTWLTFEAPNAVRLWSNLLLAQNITMSESITGPLWSLPYEVQMYLLLPFVYLLGKRMGGPLGLLGLGFALWYAEHRLAIKLGYVPLLSFTPWFFMGVAAFFRRPERRLPSWLYIVCLSMFVVGDQLINHFVGDYRDAWFQWVLGVGFCLALPMFQEIRNRAAGKVFHLIAKYSYGIYLSHVPIMWFCFVKLAGQPLVLRVILAAVLFTGLPVLLFHFVEQPFIRLGARLATARAKPLNLVASASGVG